MHPISREARHRARHDAEGLEEMGELTRMEFIEHVTALERRLNERFDLLERLMALGFDDTTDQLLARIGELEVGHERSPLARRKAGPDARQTPCAT